MFQPVVRSAKLFKGVAVAVGSVGLASMWTRKRLYVSGKSWLSDVFGENDLHYTFFTGTDSPHRKVAVQIMGVDGSIKGFAKVSANPAVKPLLEHEAETINHLNTLDLKTALIPVVLYIGEIGGACALVTDTLKTAQSRTSTKLTEAHVAFLLELAEKTAVSETASTDWVVSELRSQYAAIIDRLSEEWKGRLDQAFGCLEGYEWKWGARSLSHGDFTPWNTFFVGDNLYVFDWEYASMSFPANYDLAHMLHSLNNLSDNVDVSLLLENILNDIDKTQEPFSFGKTTFLAYLISNFLFYSSRNIKSGTDYSIDEQNVSLAKMIDFFIG
jgi:hypothetical protein